VRRVRTLGVQAELFPVWRHYPFATNRREEIALVEAEHRQHAVVELCIRDLKDQALEHFPSGQFNANAAWTVIACLAHNLLRWTELIGLPNTTRRAARTIRRRLLTLPGRLTTHAGHWTLHLPARWPWQEDFGEALTRIRALPAPPDTPRPPRPDPPNTTGRSPLPTTCPTRPPGTPIKPGNRHRDPNPRHGAPNIHTATASSGPTHPRGGSRLKLTGECMARQHGRRVEVDRVD
jgi:hypothetical protein